MLGRQRFLPKHIKRRAGQLPTIYGDQQVILDDMFTPANVDDMRANWEASQGLVVQNSVRRRGLRQRTN